jgi:T5orf172 domain
MSVYFIRAGLDGDVKIGTSIDPLKRLYSLQTSHTMRLRIIRLVEGGRKEEQEIHRRFSAHRKAREWFAFSDEILAPAPGLIDLPIPGVKRQWPHADTAWGRRCAIHQDALAIIGGVDALARRLGLPPWKVESGFLIDRHCYSAAVLMVRDAGHYHITVEKLLELDREDAEQSAANSLRVQAAQKTKYHADREAIWLNKHSRDEAWWPLVAEEPAAEKVA